MFQDFTAGSSPDQGPPRLAALRKIMAQDRIDAFLVPRADAHQGEYVAPCDERLSWLTGFSGSAGFAAILADRAGVFIDGRYRLQVKTQVAEVFTPVPWPQIKLGDWLCEHLSGGARVGFDPWLHTIREFDALKTRLDKAQIALVACDNMVDRIWDDRPPPPSAPAFAHPLDLAGEPHAAKRARLAQELRDAGHRAAVLSLPDSIAWLLNIRGADIPRIPVMQGFAVLNDDGCVDLFADPAKTQAVAGTLGDDVRLHAPHDFAAALAALPAPVRLDPASCPVWVRQQLEQAGVDYVLGDDPCVLPKACKNEAEINGTRDAHMRDAAAMVEFLSWLETEASGGTLSEIDVVRALEGFRRDTNALRDISFDTISGAGPNGAIVHYRVTHDTNRTIEPGMLLLVDSGGQYVDGTTDITRTIAIGPPGPDERAAFTRVLQGMIAISLARWPKGLSGRDLDPLARAPLWRAGQDYDHGTGHGVGSYLSVHEGPQRISRVSDIALRPGMILSNEPGYYREGAFGIRIENLVVVEPAPTLDTSDAGRDMLAFETLTWVPIDLSLVDPALLAPHERDWINAYHAEIQRRLAGRLSESAANWLNRAIHLI